MILETKYQPYTDCNAFIIGRELRYKIKKSSGDLSIRPRSSRMYAYCLAWSSKILVVGQGIKIHMKEV